MPTIKRAISFFCSLALFLIIPNATLAEDLNFNTLEGIERNKSGRQQESGPFRPSQKISAPEIFKNVDPAVVTIVQRIQGHQIAHGSGFFVKGNGYILTNNHVVDVSQYNPKYVSYITCEVVTSNGRNFQAQIVKTDPEIDLALLKIKGSGFPVVQIGDAGDINVGDIIYVIGTPVRLEFSHSITSGLISGLDRAKGRIQTSAILHGGNSGGPAVNDLGEVVGVAVAVAASPDIEHIEIAGKMQKIRVQKTKHGISYLVPINYAKNLLNLMF